MRRFWERWIWAGERRRRGEAIRRVLADWRPAAGPETGDWSRDEDRITGILAMLWQGATARDLARWLAEDPHGPLELGATEDEIAALAERLVRAYERELFSDD